MLLNKSDGEEMMKRHEGFTLVELLVGLFVTMLIMGALVSLFSGSVQSGMSGFKQQEVYAQARAVMNDIKTTLRYADSAAVFYDTAGNKISSVTSSNTKTASKVKYTATIYNASTSKNEAVAITMEWINSNKQIKITKTIDGTKQSEIKFPENDNNSAFKGDGSDFPIYISEDDSALYNINLPYKYKFAFGGTKSDALTTDVLKGQGSTSGDVPPILLTSGNLAFGSANAKLRTDGDVTLVLNADNVNNYNKGSLASSKSFDVLTNNLAIKNQSGSINIVNEYNDMDLETTIKTYTRSDKYVFDYDKNASRADLNGYPLTFTDNQQIQANNVSLWSAAKGTILRVDGANAIYAQNAVNIGSSKKAVSFALADGQTNGSLVIYSKSQMTLSNITIPKEIAVVIYAGSGLSIKDCDFENCIVIAKGGTCTISGSTICGMVESSGSELRIEGTCTFGTFKGTPSAVEVFDDILM